MAVKIKFSEAEVVNPDIILATPTKDLFITMLIRDLTLIDAIGDLIDNSVDGAKTIKPNGNYLGLYINILCTPKEFLIEDNCGGFSVDDARNYAFRFGRKDDAPETPGSIGRFGIGMKRALFKLGNYFMVASTTEKSEFVMEENVSTWRKKKDWDFKFNDGYKEKLEKPIDLKKRGTRISVTNLNTDVKEQFSDNNFFKKLRNEIELDHLYALHKGLKISVNKTELQTRELDFIHNTKFRTGYWNKTYEGLDVEIYSGISLDNGEDGGWYIFCNERLIVGPEKSYVTGWTGRKGDGGPEYHDQFHRFRGYVFFYADNSGLLPWNTTKTGMDMDSPVYKEVRKKMIEMMRPVMTLCNYLKKEREGDKPEKEKVLNFALNNARVIPLSQVVTEKNKLSDKFTFPLPEKKDKVVVQGSRILYYKPQDEIDKLKKFFGVKTNQEVGEKTFDYSYEMEIE